MGVQITGQHIEITSALREAVEKKCAKLGQHFDCINDIQVILKVEKMSQIAEATVLVNGAELHASAKHTDMYTAIDMLVDKLASQLTKYKEKLRQH